MEPKIHTCKENVDSILTVEDRGGGWFLYAGDDHGAMNLNFCTYCGADLSEE